MISKLNKTQFVYKAFDEHEIRDLGLSEKTSRILASDWMRKTCLRKERRYHTFDPEKVHFCSTFEVTVALCIAITYRVYFRNWGFRSTIQLNDDCSSIAQGGA